MPKRLIKPADEFTTFELAEHLGVAHKTIINWLRAGKIQEPARRGNKEFGRKRRWTRSRV